LFVQYPATFRLIARALHSGVRRKFSWGGGFIQWHVVVIYIWCALFVTKFVGIICIFFYMHSPYFMCHCTEYKLQALQVRISEENKPTLRQSSS